MQLGLKQRQRRLAPCWVPPVYFAPTPKSYRADKVSRFFRYLAAIAPDKAVRCLQLTIGKWERESLLQFTVGQQESSIC